MLGLLLVWQLWTARVTREVLRRHEQQLHAVHHKSVVVAGAAGRITFMLDIVADEDDLHALLAANDAAGGPLAGAEGLPA